MSITWQNELNHEWHYDEPEEAVDLLEDFVAHQVPLSAGDEGYMATTGAISKETPTPGEPPSTPELREALERLLTEKWDNHPHDKENWDAADHIYADCADDVRNLLAFVAAPSPVAAIPNSLEVLQALEALLEACPTSCEDRALIDAQRQAEQAIRRARA